MIIYLARHGQTTGDIENRYGGDYDDHLTNTGRLQSAELAKKLADKRIQLLFASPLIRAREAAIIVGRTLGMNFETLEDFRERNGYGVMTGMVKSVAEQRYPEYVAKLREDVHYTVEGGEPYDLFGKRVVTALDATSKLSAERIGIITHGGPIRLIFRDVLKQGEIDIANCAYAAIEVNNGVYSLVEMDGIALAA